MGAGWSPVVTVLVARGKAQASSAVPNGRPTGTVAPPAPFGGPGAGCESVFASGGAERISGLVLKLSDASSMGLGLELLVDGDDDALFVPLQSCLLARSGLGLYPRPLSHVERLVGADRADLEKVLNA